MTSSKIEMATTNLVFKEQQAPGVAQSRLLNLPQELQDKILEYALVDDERTIELCRESRCYAGYCNWERQSWDNYFALSSACCRLHKEAGPIFFGKNVFEISNRRGGDCGVPTDFLRRMEGIRVYHPERDDVVAVPLRSSKSQGLVCSNCWCTIRQGKAMKLEVEIDARHNDRHIYHRARNFPTKGHLSATEEEILRRSDRDSQGAVATFRAAYLRDDGITVEASNVLRKSLSKRWYNIWSEDTRP